LSYVGPLIALLGAFFLIFLFRVKASWFSFKTDGETFHELMKYAYPAFIISIAGIIFSNTQYIILTLIKNPAVTGIFGYASLVTSPLDLIPITLGSALFPIMSKLSSGNTRRKQSYLINLTIRYSLMIVLPLAAFLFYFSKQFYAIFFPNYIESASLFPFLIPGTIFLGIASIFNTSIFAVKKPNASRNVSVSTTAVFMILSIPLTILYSAKGLASAFMISTFVMFVISFYYIKKFIHFKTHVASYVKLFIATALFFVMLVSINYLTESIFLKIIFIALNLLIYFALLLVVKFFIKEDAQLIRALSRRSPIIQKQMQHFADFIEKRI